MRTPTLPRVMARILVVASLTGIAAACSGDSNAPADENTNTGHTQTPSEDGETRLRLTNKSSTSAWYVYIRQCGNPEWGADELGASNVLSPEETASWTTDNPGCYDIRALSEPGSGQKEALYMGVDVAQAQNTQVTISGSDWH